MRISYRWLKDYVDFDLTHVQLADRLTMAGLEVEGMERLDGEPEDWALEINVTPNRPDCLSMMGIAREVAAITRGTLKPPKPRIKETGNPIDELVKVEIDSPELCPRYAGRLITGVSVAASPDWLTARLTAVGARPVNNIVDVTNYVMLEMGQPLHAFDFDLVEGHRIIVRTASEGEAFTTLDGLERKLEAGTLLICDGVKPVAVAGVMGGQNSEVSDKTVNVFLEAAYFSPAGVRRSSKRLGLHTEASHRFERGTDPEGVIPALERAASLIAEIAGGRVAKGRVDEYPGHITMPEVKVRVGSVNAVLGAELVKAEVKDVLGRLHIQVKDEGKDTLTVTAPAFRPDLTREADFIEEIARIHGYGKIKSALPIHAMNASPRDESSESVTLVKRALIQAGFSEAINYSFINPAEFDRLKLPDDDFRRSVVRLQNPLTEEQSVMRTTLLPSLIGNLALNVSRGVRDLKLFEVSRVFLSHGPGLPDEPLRVAGIAAGRRTGGLWDGHGGDFDFFDLKGTVETLLESLRVTGAFFKPAPDAPFLHPGKGAWLVIGGSEAGCLGEAHPDVMRAYDLSAGRAFIFELDMQALTALGGVKPTYSPMPKFPAVERDVAVIVSEDVSSSSVLKTIESLKLELIEEVKLFDYYMGKPIPKGRKSLAYTIIYRSLSRTLTDIEVNEAHQVVVDALREKLGAELREQ